MKMQHMAAFAALASTGLAIAATTRAQQSQPATNQTPAVSTPTGEPTWFSSIDIGKGVELETWIGFTPNVVNPATNTTVRPVNMHMNFIYGVGVMQQIDLIKLKELNDTTPETFQIAGLDRQVVAPQRPPHDILNCSVTIGPKPNYTWGTIRGALDLNIVTTEF